MYELNDSFFFFSLFNETLLFLLPASGANPDSGNTTETVSSFIAVFIVERVFGCRLFRKSFILFV